jgi:hypothetical protein
MRIVILVAAAVGSILASVGLVAGAPAQGNAATATTFEAGLTGYEVVPPVLGAPSSNGIARFTFVRATNELFYDLSIVGVSDSVTGAGLYNAAVGANGPLLRSLTQTAPDHFAGSVVLSETEASELRTGRLYVSVSSMGRQDGVARAQLFPPEPNFVCTPSPLGRIEDDDPRVVVVYASSCRLAAEED